MSNVAHRIKKRAEQLGLSQAEIARMTDVTRGSVNQWFLGPNLPKGKNMMSLAKVLRTTPDWILTGKGSVDVASSSSANSETLKQAARIIRNAEMLSGQPFSIDEFADKMTEIYFRLESNLSLNGVIQSENHQKDLMVQAGIKAQQVFEQVLARPGLILTDEEKKKLYSDILNDSYNAIVLQSNLNESDYLKA